MWHMRRRIYVSMCTSMRFAFPFVIDRTSVKRDRIQCQKQ